MQKIKEEKGITLAILIVTIIVLLIVVGITMDIGFDTADSAKISQQKSELQIVGQATISEYAKAMELNYLVNKNDSEEGYLEVDENIIPSNFIGEVLEDDEIPTLPVGSWVLPRDTAVGYKSYFRLTPEDLDRLNISNTTDTYIINYYTGEVYNETKQFADDGSILYLRLDNATHTEREEDTTSFTN